MENLAPNAEVRLVVSQCFRTLTTSAENREIISALQTLHSYLDEGSDSRITPVGRAEFRKAHFTRTLRFLVSNIQADWTHHLKAQTRRELWDGLFLQGPPEQTLLVLMEGIGELRSVPSDKRHLHNIFVSLFSLFLICEVRFLRATGFVEVSLKMFCLLSRMFQCLERNITLDIRNSKNN